MKRMLALVLALAATTALAQEEDWVAQESLPVSPGW